MIISYLFGVVFNINIFSILSYYMKMLNLSRLIEIEFCTYQKVKFMIN